MIVDDDAVAGVLRKRAESALERRQLGVEADVLRAAAHPGVVQVMRSAGGPEPEVLELRRVAGSTIGERSPLAATDVAWIGAALATTVADLHDIGIVHGAIDATHVLIDERGRPILCGFGSACRASAVSDFARARDADVAALAGLLIDVGRELPGARVSAALHAARRGGRWKGRRGDARSLARVLGLAASWEQPPVESGGRRSARRLLAVVAVPVTAGAVLGATVGLAASGGSRHGSIVSRSGRSAGAGPCPTQDDGCVPLSAPGGVIGGRFRILGAAGVTVLGRWDCGRDATPAVLDRASGRVWVFDSWPSPDQRVVARLLGTVQLATSLRVVPAADAGKHLPSGCDRIAVQRAGRTPVIVDP